jgi:hypothetical protein
VPQIGAKLLRRVREKEEIVSGVNIGRVFNNMNG